MEVAFEDIVENMNDEQLNTFLKKILMSRGEFSEHFDDELSDADYADTLTDFILSNYPGKLPEGDTDEEWKAFYAPNSPFVRYENAIHRLYGRQPASESITEVDANGDGDTDVVATDTDDNGKEDTAIVTAESLEEAKEGIKEAVDMVKDDNDSNDEEDEEDKEIEVDSTGTAKLSDEKEKDVKGTCYDVNMKNIMSSLLNHRY